MKTANTGKIFLSFGAALLLSACSGDKKQDKERMSYPETKTEEVSDTYFGTEVKDPYRWLENDTTAETAEWVKAQNKFTFSYLDQIPYRDSLNDRITELYNYEKYSAPFQEGGWTYYYKNNGLQNQSVLYRQKPGGEAEVFLDPNTLSEDGTSSLGSMSFTEDGSLVAYSVSKGGADWQTIYVMNAETKELMTDQVPDVKFSGISWKGNEGFFYSKYDDKNGSKLSSKTENHKVFYHKLGTPVSEDKVYFGNDENPRRYVGARVSKDRKWLIVTTAMTTTGNQMYLLSLDQDKQDTIVIADSYDNDFGFVRLKENLLYVITNLNAPMQRVVAIDIMNPALENWKDIIPEAENVLSVSKGGGYLFAKYLRDALGLVIQYDYDGNRIREVELPGQGTVYGFGGKEKQKKLYYVFTSYIYPSTIFSYDPATGKSELYRKPKIDFNPEDYISKQVFYQSKDGTRIPMMLTYKKGLTLSGENPTLLYGYGGFNISLTPRFNPMILVLLEKGGIYAVPNLRGGGEYGERWHLAGTKMQKQNVFDDFIGAAQFLITEKYTSSEKLAISGGSNGGLLVGATMTQRPDLMKVAFPAVGVLDMLRYHKFTAGAGWASDYGTSEESKEMFEYLLGYSPLHNIKKGKAYPATMVTTGDHDDRVVPAHSFKFAATLQQAQSGEAPILIRINVNAGHGAGKPTDMLIREQADKFAFMLWNMGYAQLN